MQELHVKLCLGHGKGCLLTYHIRTPFGYSNISMFIFLWCLWIL